MDFICNNTCRVWQERKDYWGKVRGGQKRGHSKECEPGQGCQKRWAVQGGTGGSLWHLCSSGTGVEQSRRDALCWQKVPVVCPLQEEGECRLDPPCQSLAILGSWACSLQPQAAMIAKGFEFLIPCRAVGILAAFCVENCIFEPSPPFKPQFSPTPAQRGACSPQDSCSLLLT